MTAPEAQASAPAPKPRRRRWPVVVATLLVVPLLLFAIYTFFVVSWSYSDGERSGTLQKFSRKGWLCKTYEGELAQYVVGGVAPQIWYFTVRDETLVRQMSDAVGQNVQVHYSEHRGVPTNCFGDTPYWVDQVKAIPK
ncbi:MAG: hypothetical protein H6Q77_45 [Gemmatimonadetes bacterium]|nr:hypothetical protein [Gemmatimonadota bacterium]